MKITSGIFAKITGPEYSWCGRIPMWLTISLELLGALMPLCWEGSQPRGNPHCEMESHSVLRAYWAQRSSMPGTRPFLAFGYMKWWIFFLALASLKWLFAICTETLQRNPSVEIRLIWNKQYEINRTNIQLVYTIMVVPLLNYYWNTSIPGGQQLLHLQGPPASQAS